jgi:hypothetical protein
VLSFLLLATPPIATALLTRQLFTFAEFHAAGYSSHCYNPPDPAALHMCKAFSYEVQAQSWKVKWKRLSSKALGAVM